MHRFEKTGRLRVASLLAGLTLLWLAAGNTAVYAKGDTASALPRSDVPAEARVRAASAKRPLSFEKNVGQVKGPEGQEVKFVSRGSAYTLFLTSTKAVLVLRQGDGKQSNAGKVSSAVVTMRLAKGASVPNLKALDEQPGKSNYFIGKDPSQWRTGVPNYGRVAASGVYPGIDLVYHGNQGQLEYDFELAPHADARKIRFVLEGIQGVRTDAQGDLLVKVAGGELQFRQPVAYQKAGGVERPVPVRYVLQGRNQVSFRLAPYDTRQPLVIDPVLAYSTYLGGSNIDYANGIAVAPDGTAFIAGGTFSADFPTAHALQPNVGGPYDFPQDAFVAKLSADGSTLLYSTYLGGTSQDVANAIAVDAAGEAFVTGTTLSTNFPVTAGSFDPLCGGDGKCGATWNPQGLIVSNAFVTKLNIAGSALVYSSYLGYYEDVEGRGIAVDGDLNAYVTGATTANITPTVTIVAPLLPPPPFPIVGGFQATFGGGSTNAFLTKISATGSGILYSSYLGGSNEDVGYGIAVDTHANAYATGLTYSSNFPLTDTITYTSPHAPLQNVYAGAGDAFLSKVNTNGTGQSSLLYSTYLGGSGLDQGNSVAVDASGNAYVAGGTTSIASSLGFTAPAGAFQADCALDTLGVCEGDAMVAKFNPTLSGAASLVYFTYLGGSLADSAAGIAVNSSGNAYVTGSTVSTNFPIHGAVFQPNFGGGNADAFVTELNPTGASLVYSTFLGGSNTDTGAGIAIDVNGGAYVTGETCSLDFPLANPLQATPGGNCDAFISKIVPSGGVELSPAGLTFPIQAVNTTSVPSQTVTLTNGGNTALTISSIVLTGADTSDFSQNNTCDGSVPALGQCTITVTFTPQAVGTRTAHITITDNLPAPNSTQVVDLSGTGGTLPTVVLSATSLPFGNQAVNVASAPQYLTVTNTGTAALNITSVIASGDFAVKTNACGAPLQPTSPPSNCTITVIFTPSAPGTSVGSLTLTDNASNSPQIVLLTGTGVIQPGASVSTSSLTFGSQSSGTTSAAQTVTLTSTGASPLTISNIAVTGDFSQTNTCPQSLAAGNTCTISVLFTPTAVGTRTGTLTITDNAPNSPQVVSLGGSGSDFSLAVTPTTVTVVAGNSTNLTVTLTPLFGYNAQVTLSCSGLPGAATCAASPSAPTLNGVSPATSTMVIRTTRRTAVPPGGHPWPQGPGLALRLEVWLMLAALMGLWSMVRKNRLRWATVALALTLLLLTGLAACGGGGTAYVNPTGTPAGTYNVMVVGSVGNFSHSATVSVTVQ